MSDHPAKPNVQKPVLPSSFARRAPSHKQEKRERRVAYRQFVNRFRRKKEDKQAVKGVRQTPARLGFEIVMAIGRALADGRWSYKRRLLRRSV